MIIDVGFPAPWPAFVSIRKKIVFGFEFNSEKMKLLIIVQLFFIVFTWFPLRYCSSAMYLYEWDGTTRSSWSAVANKTCGYSTFGLIVCSGEYLHHISSLLKALFIMWTVVQSNILLHHVFEFIDIFRTAIVRDPIRSYCKLMESQHVTNSDIGDRHLK